MPAMTVHERMMAVYRKELPDRIPVSIYAWHLPRGSFERVLRDMGLGLIDWHAAVSLLAPPWHVSSGVLSEVRGADFRISLSWEDGQQVETHTYCTPVGTISRQTIKDPSYGSDWVRKFYVTEPEDYKVLQYLIEHTVFRRNESALQTKKKDLGTDGVVLGRIDRCPYQKLLIELAGPERFLMDLYTDPGPVTELLQVMSGRMDEAFEIVLESQADAIWQPDNITVDMTPPDCFRKYCMPFYERYGKRLEDLGKPYLVHMDGRLAPLKDLIARCPFDAVESMSFPDVGGDLSFSEARSAWPDKVILPNFPAPLCYKDDPEIEAYLDRLLAEVGTRTAFMLQVSEDIPATEWQRVLHILCRFMRDRGNTG